MDTGLGKFAQISHATAKTIMESVDTSESPIFQVGLKVFIRSAWFKIKRIRRKDLILRLINNGDAAFAVGETIRIQGSYFRIKKIRQKEMIARLLPKPEPGEKP